MARWALVCTTRDELRIVVQGAPVLAGRREDAQLRLPIDDLRASRRHATFELAGDELLLRDLGSSTGTFVNDQRVEHTKLAENDLVRMGGLAFRVERVTDVRKKELRPARRRSEGGPAVVTRRCHLCGADGVSKGVVAPELGVAWICEACASARRSAEGCPEPMPTAIGDWEVLRFLDRGGMSIVFEARHREEGLHAALKLLRMRTPFDEVRRRRFTREQQLVVALDHPAIVRAFEIGEDAAASEVFIASEFVAGGDAEQIASPTSPVDQVFLLAADLFSALAYAHEHGVVHRDVKPPNLLLHRDAQGRLRGQLADFGLAKSLQDLGEGYETADGEIAGSFEFMAPEQALALKGAGEAADLYSAAATIYYCLTEQLPFDAGPDGRRLQGLTRLALATIRHERVPLRARRADVPEEAARILDLLVSREPERRAHLRASALAAAFEALANPTR